MASLSIPLVLIIIGAVLMNKYKAIGGKTSAERVVGLLLVMLGVVVVFIFFVGLISSMML